MGQKPTTDPATSMRSATTLTRSAEPIRNNSTTTGPAPDGAENLARSGTGGPPLAPGRDRRIVGGLLRPDNWTPASALAGLINDPRGAIADRSPADLYRTGLSIHDALKVDRRSTKILLLAELGRLWRAVKVGDAKTWDGQEALQDAVDDLVEIFPSMKIEEVLKVFQMIRRGEVKIYGRLDTPTLLDAVRNYEDTHTTTIRENYRPHLEIQDVQTNALDAAPARAGQMTVIDALRRIAREMPAPRRTLEDLGGHLHLTEAEVLAIERNNTPNE